MAFGDLTYNNKKTYDFTQSSDFAIRTILNNLGKVSKPIVGGNQPQEEVLKNRASEGHVDYLN